jgi:hypothetical protein
MVILPFGKEIEFGMNLVVWTSRLLLISVISPKLILQNKYPGLTAFFNVSVMVCALAAAMRRHRRISLVDTPTPPPLCMAHISP